MLSYLALCAADLWEQDDIWQRLRKAAQQRFSGPLATRVAGPVF